MALEAEGPRLLEASRFVGVAQGGPGDVEILDSEGRTIATAPLPVLPSRSVILPEGGGETVAEDRSWIVAPWPAGAHSVRVGGTTIESPPCALVDDKSDGSRAVPLWSSGDPAQRFNLVILGDGYTAADQATLRADAERISDGFLAFEPWASYRELVNVWYVPARSREPGGGRDGVAKDTAYGCYYGCGGQDRLLCCDDERAQRAAQAAVPAYDAVLVIVNDAQYGGSGGTTITTTYNGPSAIEIARHELGHQAGLHDEYVYPGTTPSPAPDLAPNCSRRRTTTPWEPWRSQAGVGAFTGCQYGDYFRPTESECVMRTIGKPYCPVCREHLVRRLFQRAGRLALSTSPSTNTLVQGPSTLAVTPLLDDPSVHYEWDRDGVPIPAAAGSRLSVPGCAHGTVGVKVFTTTDWVRSDPDEVLVDRARWVLACPTGAPPIEQAWTSRTSIPDGAPAGLSTSLSLAAGSRGALEASVEIAHDAPRELYITLTHGADEFVLWDRASSGSSMHLRVPVPAVGELGGAWTLKIVDGVANKKGRLERWSLWLHAAP